MSAPRAEAAAAVTDAWGPSAAVLRVFPALGDRAFRLFWLSILPAMIAWQMNVIALGYAAFTLSGSATVLGVVSLALGLPTAVLVLPGGVVADILPRRTTLLVTQTTFGLAAAGTALLALTGTLEVWHLIVLALIQAVVSAFNMPTRQAYIADLAGPRLLRNAVALNNAGMNFCRIAGPALAGALLAMPSVGVGGVFAFMATMYALVLIMLLRLPGRPPAADAAHRGQSSMAWEHLLEGLRYIRTSPKLLALMGLAFVPVFFGMPYQSLMPLFAERVFSVGAGGLGVLMAAVGLGALVGSVTVAVLTNFSRPALLQLGLGVAFGLALIGFALAPSFGFAVVALLLVGFSSSSYNVLNSTLVMANTEPRLYGRVMSVHMLTFSMMPLGAMPAAWIADHVGGPPVIALGGLIVAAAVASVAILYPPYRSIR